MSNLLEIPLLKHQLAFVEDIDTPHLGLVAGYGSGKTYAFVIKAIYMASLNIGHTGLLLEPTFTMVTDALMPMMDFVLAEMGLNYKMKSSPQPEYQIEFEDGWATIKLRSAENWRRLAGINAAWFGVDEIDTISNKELIVKMWRMLISRVRKGNVFQGFTTSTPEGYKFLYDYFVTNGVDDKGNPKKDRRLIKARTYDNPFLPKTTYKPDGSVDELGYIDKLRQEYPANLIDAYLNGEFVNLTSGNVYSNFDRKVNFTNKTFSDFPQHEIHMGVDFNIGKMATTYSVVDLKDNPAGLIYTLEESWGCYDTEALIAETKRRFPGRRIIVYPDSSVQGHTGINDVVLFKNAGFTVKVDRSNPKIDQRVGSMNAMFKNGLGKPRHFVNIERCPKFVRSLEQQGYVEDKPDKSNDLDHPADANGYFVQKTFPSQAFDNRPKIRIYN